MKQSGLVAVWLLLACLRVQAQTAVPSSKPGVSYLHSQLTVDMADVSLGDVLNLISSMTEVKMDVPSEAFTTRLPRIQAGPGPARDVLASLLHEMHFNYVVLASESDPNAIQRLLVMTPEKSAPAESTPDPLRLARMGRSGAQAEAMARQDAEPRAAVEAEPATSAAGTNPAPSPPAADTPSAALPIPEARPAVEQDNNSLSTRRGALSPPANLDQNTINQQLQQMYQQRVQMNQARPTQGQP